MIQAYYILVMIDRDNAFFPEYLKGYTYHSAHLMAEANQRHPPRLFMTEGGAKRALAAWRKGPHVRKFEPISVEDLWAIPGVRGNEAVGTEPAWGTRLDEEYGQCEEDNLKLRAAERVSIVKALVERPYIAPFFGRYSK